MVDAKIYGIITENGEEKLIREHESVRGRLKISLYEARRAKNDAELSRTIVRYDGRKVLEIHWNEACDFDTIKFEPGEE